jgi:hypothetical protein
LEDLAQSSEEIVLKADLIWQVGDGAVVDGQVVDDGIAFRTYLSLTIVVFLILYS